MNNREDDSGPLSDSSRASLSSSSSSPPALPARTSPPAPSSSRSSALDWKARACSQRLSPPASARPSLLWIACGTAPAFARSGLWPSRASLVAGSIPTSDLSSAAAASRRRAVPSRGRSRSPASSTARRASLLGCGPSPRGRTLQLASKSLCLRACPYGLARSSSSPACRHLSIPFFRGDGFKL